MGQPPRRGRVAGNEAHRLVIWGNGRLSPFADGARDFPISANFQALLSRDMSNRAQEQPQQMMRM